MVPNRATHHTEGPVLEDFDEYVFQAFEWQSWRPALYTFVCRVVQLEDLNLQNLTIMTINVHFNKLLQIPNIFRNSYGKYYFWQNKQYPIERQNYSRSTYALFCNGNQKILMLELCWLT